MAGLLYYIAVTFTTLLILSSLYQGYRKIILSEWRSRIVLFKEKGNGVTGRHSSGFMPASRGYVQVELPLFVKLGQAETARVLIFQDSGTVSGRGYEAIKIGAIMTVKLVGTDAVQIINVIEKEVAIQKQNTWQWWIKGLHRGIQKIVLTIDMVIDGNNGSTALYNCLNRTYAIKVISGPAARLNQFWLQNWQWIVQTVLGTGALWTLLRWFGNT